MAKYRGRRNNSKNILAKGDLIRFIRLGYRRRYTLRINIAIAFRNDDNRVVLLRQRPCDKMLSFGDIAPAIFDLISLNYILRRCNETRDLSASKLKDKPSDATNKALQIPRVI